MELEAVPQVYWRILYTICYAFFTLFVGFGVFSPPNKAPIPPKWKYETL